MNNEAHDGQHRGPQRTIDRARASERLFEAMEHIESAAGTEDVLVRLLQCLDTFWERTPWWLFRHRGRSHELELSVCSREAMSSWGKSYLGDVITVPSGPLARWLFAHRRPVILKNPERDARIPANLRGKMKTELCCLMPMIVKRQYFGLAIGLTSPQQQRFGLDTSIHILKVLITFSGLALESALLYEQRQRVVNQIHTFTYGIIHDMKTPIITAGAFADMLDQFGFSHPQAGHFLERIRCNARLADSLISKLLDMLRQTNSAEQRGLIEVEMMVHEIWEDLSPIITGRNVSLQLHYLPSVYFAHSQLRRVLANLISNALDHLHEDRPGVISVRAERYMDFIHFCVRDNGRGIPQKDIGRVFDLFFTAKDHGSGIGLAVVKQIIESAGGSVWVESVPGEGSSFYFSVLADECARPFSVQF